MMSSLVSGRYIQCVSTCPLHQNALEERCKPRFRDMQPDNVGRSFASHCQLCRDILTQAGTLVVFFAFMACRIIPSLKGCLPASSRSALRRARSKCNRSYHNIDSCTQIASSGLSSYSPRSPGDSAAADVQYSPSSLTPVREVAPAASEGPGLRDFLPKVDQYNTDAGTAKGTKVKAVNNRTHYFQQWSPAQHFPRTGRIRRTILVAMHCVPRMGIEKRRAMPAKCVALNICAAQLGCRRGTELCASKTCHASERLSQMFASGVSRGPPPIVVKDHLRTARVVGSVVRAL